MAVHKQVSAGPRTSQSEIQSAGPSPADLAQLNGDAGTLMTEFQERLQQTLHSFKLKAAKQVVEDLPKITARLIERTSAELDGLSAAASQKMRDDLKSAGVDIAEETRRGLSALGEETIRSFEAGFKAKMLGEISAIANEQSQVVLDSAQEAARSITSARGEAQSAIAAAREEHQASLRLEHEKRLQDLEARGQESARTLDAVQASASSAVTRLEETRARLESSLLPDLGKKAGEISASCAQEIENKIRAGVEAAGEQLENTLSQFRQKSAARIEEDLSKTAAELLRHSAERLEKQTEEARERLLASLRSSGSTVLEETERQLESFRKTSSAVINQNAKAAAEKAVASAAGMVEEEMQKSIEASAERGVARIEAEQQKLQARAELSVAEHQKQLLLLSVQGVEGVQRQIDNHLEAFRGQLQSCVRLLEQKALEKATEDFPEAAAALIDNAAGTLQKKADEAAETAQKAFQSAAAAFTEESRRMMIQEAGDSLRSLREQAMEQSRSQLRELAKDAAMSHRKEFTAEIEAALRKQRKSIQHQMDEACRASLAQLQQASANLAPGYARQTSSASRWVLVVAALIPTILFLYLMNRPVMRLKSEPPAEFLNAYPEWTSQHQDVATKLGEAYWDWAALHLARDYPFGSALPEQPPVSFEVGGQGFPTGVEADVARMRYWNKLRELWTNPQSWERVEAWNRH